MSWHQRLSALDASFLGIETPQTHMHVGGLLIFDAGPLATEDGGIDFERIRAYVESALGNMPRFRQRIEWVPGLEHPVWVDDQSFKLSYHLRHTALPRPGDDRVLKRLTGRIFSQKLDRTRPLWEVWVVEGLQGNRFALIPKLHHCMIDGVAGVDALAALFRGTPDDSIPERDEWKPRQAPSRSELLLSEVDHRVRGSRAAFTATRKAMEDMPSFWESARDTASGIASTLSFGLVPATESSLNLPTISPHRRFDVCELELQAVKEVKSRLGAKVNDVVLATVAGALSRFLGRRGMQVDSLVDFRALVPVNLHRPGEEGAGANRVAMMLAPLPLAERNPVRRLERIRETMSYLKTQSKQAESAELLEEISDYTFTGLVRDVLRIAGRQRAYNVVVTNVAGPPFPLYLLGAQLKALYPLVPLFHNQTVGIALFSYTGRLCWGLVGDWHAAPDLHELVTDLRDSFVELEAAALPADTDAGQTTG